MSSQPNSSDALWSSLAERVFNSPTGIHVLSLDEQTFFAARYFKSEHYNGGFEQVFDNGTGDYYREIVAALSAIGASQTCGLLKLAARIAFKGKQPPRDDNGRFQIMSSHCSSRWQDELDVLDGAVDDCGENVVELAEHFATEKGLLAVPMDYCGSQPSGDHRSSDR